MAPAGADRKQAWLWEGDLRPDGPAVIDTLALSAAEWAAFSPPLTAVGTEWPIPSAIARRFVRVLSPSSDQSTMPRPQDATEAALTGRVEAIEGTRARLRFNGRWAAKRVYDGKASYAWAYGDGIALWDTERKAPLSLLLAFSGAYRMAPPYDTVDRPTGAIAEWKWQGENGVASDDSLPQGDGLAVKYPGDRGIAGDSRVVFAEGFEGTLDGIRSRWESVQAPEGIALSDDSPPVSAGKRSLLMTHVGGKGSGSHLYRRLLPGYDRLFARFYVKFDPACAPIHHFGTHLGGFNPPTPYPQGGAGERPRGDQRFTVGIEPFGDAWTWDYYAYWGEMRASPPRGQTWGNSFIRDPELRVQRGKWTCVEFMIDLNDPPDRNGELALWIDGKRVSHLRKGSPRGRWIFDKFEPGKGGEAVRWSSSKGDPENYIVPEGGEPFEGFRWRTDKALNINYIWTYLYITKAPAGHVSKVWFDDIVIAQEYIGPLKP